MILSWFVYTLALWSGLLIGVSFIATPVKFMAPNLTIPVALEIGKITFHIFNKIEWSMLAMVLMTAYVHNSLLKYWWLTGSLVTLMIAETFWLLPALDISTNQVIAGKSAAPGKLHWFYIIADSLKLIILMIGAWWTVKEANL